MSGFPRTPHWRFEPGSGVLKLWTTRIPADMTDEVTLTCALAGHLATCLSWIVAQETAARNARYEDPEPDPSPSSADLDEWALTLEGVARQMREAGECDR